MRQNHSVLPRRVLLGLSLVVAALFATCKSRTIPEGQCEFNADCSDNQICVGQYCRAQCRAPGADADCATYGMGWTCRSSGLRTGTGAAARPVYICLPPGEPSYCVDHSDCEAPLVCTRDGRCGVQCRQDYDCQRIALDSRATCLPDGTCSFRDGGAGDDAHTEDAHTEDAPAADASSGDASDASGLNG